MKLPFQLTLRAAVGLFFGLCNQSLLAEVTSPFALGEQVRLSRDEPLYFQQNAIETGRKGSVFTVAKVDAAARRTYVFSKRPNGTTLGLNIASDALESAFPARFTTDEARMLRAGSWPYFLNNQLQASPEKQDETITENLASSNEALKGLAKSASAKLAIMEAEEALPEKRKEAMQKMDRQMRGLFGEALAGAMMGRQMGDGAAIEVAGRVGMVMADAKAQEFSLLLASEKISNDLRERIEQIAIARANPPHNGKLPVSVTARAYKGLLWAEVKNNSPYALKQCVITSKRQQDAKLLNQRYQNRAVAEVWTTLLISPEAGRASYNSSGLELDYLEMERSGSIFVPEIPAGGTARFAISYKSGLEFTKSVAVSLWSNEGVALSVVPSNLTEVLKPFQTPPTTARNGGWQSSGNGASQSGYKTKNRSMTGGLDTADGLDSAKGGLGATRRVR